MIKRAIINIFAFLIIVVGSISLTNTSNANLITSPEPVEETTCGECSTTDPNKCCKTKLFGRCEIFTCEDG